MELRTNHLTQYFSRILIFTAVTIVNKGVLILIYLLKNTKKTIILLTNDDLLKFL